MASKQKVTISQIKQALQASGGNVSQAANSLPITRERLHQRIRANEGLKEYVDNLRVDVTQLVQTKLVEEVKAGNVKAMGMWLNYITKIEKLKMDNIRHERLYTELYTKNDDVLEFMEGISNIITENVKDKDVGLRIGRAILELATKGK